MKTLIIGFGEVGRAINAVLWDKYWVEILDSSHIGHRQGLTKSINQKQYDIIHICFPYSKTFIKDVKAYQKKYKPKYTVIHSTVPVGTSRKLGAVHSPIRGIHPNLEGGVRTFTKFLGGERASEVADYFRRAGLRVCLFDRAETSEALKLFDTEYYRACIEFAHRVKRYCEANDLSFHEVYTLGNQTYNEGYTKLDHPEFVRPVLQPIMTPIGGHCVTQNSKLIND